MAVGRFSSHPLPMALVIAASFIGGKFATADDSMGAAATRQGPIASETPEWSSFEEADRVYHETILAGVVIEDRVAELKADTSGSVPARAQRLYLASLLQWRHGDREAALSSVDEALDIDRHGALLHQRGRLLEALSRIDEAIEAYREALPLLSGSARTDTELRMALLIASERGEIEPLLSLAEGSDAAVQNRVAMVLAVLGHTGEAASLYSLPAGASAERRWRHALRLTEWGLWARDPGRARDAAWRAVDLAESEQDRLYVLALLTEAYRQADALPELVEALESGRDVGGDRRALWVSLLREIDRPADALAALEGSVEREPAAVKRQFLGIHRESSRAAEVVAELERLMAVDPDETIWPQGLAEFYLERGDRSQAEAAWRGFVDRAEAAPALLDGAAAMLKLGFEELALAAAEQAQRNTVSNRAGRDAALDPAARFRFELYLQRGRWVEARQVLQSLEAATAASDPMRQSIAMAYERLNLPAEALRVMTALVEARDSVDSEAGVETSLYLAHLSIANDEPQRAVDLLLAALPDASAAQLRLLHTRLIAAARTAGLDDALVTDLTAKLDDGRATVQETQLLIEMRIRAHDEAEALALIDTIYGQAGADPVAKLQQIAALHRMLGDWRAYDDTLAQLIERDADNAVFHVRSRIINYIDSLRWEAEDDQEVSDTLIALLEQYLAVSEVGADREFVAGVLAMGGQHEAAIGIYREILAVDPSRADSYLEIGNQLHALQQAPRAVGMYQYLLESSDRREISWVALDGILNLLPDRPTLEWARRMALLRVSAAPNQFEYYRQLADLSLDLEDNERQLAALYNGLAAEPQLRLATLRELLRATDSINQSADAAPVGSRDISLHERHVAFGRRLLTLGLALPPDVHLSLGRAMIAAGDADAALSAINQAVEHTGSDRLLVRAARLFRQAGDDLSAHRLFEQALRNDPDNLDLLVDTAWSNERMGHKQRAGELFLEGLTTLLTRQPLRSEAVLTVAGRNKAAEILDERQLNDVLLDEGRELLPMENGSARTHAVEYQQYYIPLRNGLVRMLLGERQQRDAALSRLQSDYAATLALVRARQSVAEDPNQLPPRPSALVRVANYPRLRLQAQLVRYLAYTFGDYTAVNEMDETLLTLFPEDALLPEILVSHRAEWGSFAYLDWLDDAAMLSAAQKETLARHWLASANDTDEGLLAVRARFDAAPSTVEATWQRELDRALRAGDAVKTVQVVKRLAETELIWETLDKVEPHLSAADKKAVAEHVIPILRNDPDKATDSLRIHISHTHRRDLRYWPQPWAARLEDWTGHPVFDQERLAELASLSFNYQAGSWQRGTIDPWFVYHALAGGSREKWLKQVREQSVWAPVAHVVSLVSLLLQVEQDEATAASIARIVREDQGFFLPWDLTLDRVDIHPANVPLARELVAIVRKKHPGSLPDPVFEPNFLRCEGKAEAALNKLVEIYFDGELPSVHDDMPRDAISLIKRYQAQLVSGNESKLIDIANRRKLSSPQAERQRNLLLIYLQASLYDGDPQKLRQVVRDALRIDPANHELRQLAADIYGRTGERFAAHELMQMQLEYYAGHAIYAGRRDDQLRQLVASSRKLDHPIETIAYQSALGQGPAAPAVVTMTSPEPVGDPVAIARALTGEDFAALRRELERLWQQVLVSEHTVRQKQSGLATVRLSSISSMSLNREQFWERVQSGDETAEIVPMLAELARHPLGVEVLETWLTTVRGRLLNEVPKLVDALANGHVYQGTAGARFAELGAAIEEERAGDKEIDLWLALGSRVPELAASHEANARRAIYGQAETAYRPSLLLRMAEFLAAGGDTDGARHAYHSLVRWSYGHGSRSTDGSANEFSVNVILTFARKMLDGAAYQRLLRDVLDGIKPREDYLLTAYSKFVLDQFDAADDRQAFYRAFQTDVDDALRTLNANDDDVFRLMRVAITQLRLDQGLLPLDTLLRAMEAYKAHRDSQTAGAFVDFERRFHDGEEGRLRADELGVYRYMLGLGHGDFSRQGDVTIRLVIALVSPGGLPEQLFAEAGLRWLRQADVEMRRRIEAGDVDRDLGIGLLLSLSRVYGERDAGKDQDRLLAYLKTQLAYADEITSATAADIAAAAEDLGQDLNDARLEAELLLNGAIEPERMAAALRRIATAEGETAALEVGSRLLEFTLNDALMDELIALADANARPAQADEWRLLQREARLARAELERTEALAQIF